MPYKLDNKKQIYERIPIPPFFLPFPLIARLPCSVLLWWPQSARILTLCDDHVCVSMWAIVPMSPGSGRVRSESPDHKTLPPPLTTTAPPPAHVQLITVFDPRMSSEQRLWPQMTRVRSSATTGEWWPHTDQGASHVNHWPWRILVTQGRGGAPGRIVVTCQQTAVIRRSPWWARNNPPALNEMSSDPQLYQIRSQTINRHRIVDSPSKPRYRDISDIKHQ